MDELDHSDHLCNFLENFVITLKLPYFLSINSYCSFLYPFLKKVMKYPNNLMIHRIMHLHLWFTSAQFVLALHKRIRTTNSVLVRLFYLNFIIIYHILSQWSDQTIQYLVGQSFSKNKQVFLKVNSVTLNSLIRNRHMLVTPKLHLYLYLPNHPKVNLISFLSSSVHHQ